ncbi:MAG: serine hydrolase [Rhodanobacteraceae bacterium]|nr:serine hydrolase [Rhodanobacteraceae bacterium]
MTASSQALCLRVMHTVFQLVVAALLGCSAVAGAQDNSALPAPVQNYLATGSKSSNWAQLSAAFLSQSTESFTNYPAEAGRSDSNTPVLLGDAAAALTGLLLADLASGGRVRLDDPIRRYLPQGSQCADTRVCDLTLQELVTQTSGLPLLPTNLFPVDSRDIWRDYREEDLVAFLANYRLPDRPQPRESPLGNLLLAWLLGRAHGQGYAVALAERVTHPLRLDHTRLEPRSAGTLPSRVYTSVGDLSRLLQAMLRPADSPARAALLLSRQQRDPRASWGLGWRIAMVRADEQEWPLVWQATRDRRDGNVVFFGFRTDRQQAFAVAGRGNTNLAPLGLALLGDSALPELPSVFAALPSGYAGLYEASPGEQFVVRDPPRPSLQASGRLAVDIMPLGPDLFEVVGTAARLSFQRDVRGQIEAFRLAENGVIVPVRRLSGRTPYLQRAEIALSTDKKREYCGDYEVDSEVIARLHCGNRLTLQFSGTQQRELFAYAEDRFATHDGELELIAQRDEGGQVSALTLVLLGSETTLARTQWLPVPEVVTAALAEERRERQTAAMRDATSAATQSPADEAAPWISGLPVLPQILASPYRAPGAATAAETRVPVPKPRAKGGAQIRAAAPVEPARIEALPEHFERPRFAPLPEEKAKEASDDGT